MKLTSDQLRRYSSNPVALILEQFVLEVGEPYGAVIQPFQREFFDAVFARKDGDVPEHRMVYVERRRGESKTEDLAAAALADLVTGPDLHHSYVVAADEDQAALVIDSITGFKVRSPILQAIDVDRLVVRNRATGSELRILSSDARTNYGKRPRRVFFDELSLQQNDRLWLAMWTAVGKKASAQMVTVTMSGWDFTGLAWKIRGQAQANPAYFFATREGTEPAPWLSSAQMEEQRATLHPSDFARFWECRWTEPQGSWITREMYEAAETGVEAFRGNPESDYVGFVDVGLVHDATAIAVCHQEGDVVVLDTLRTLRGSRSEPVEIALIEEIVMDLTRSFGVKEWTFESPQAAASVQRLSKILPVPVEIRQPTVDTQARLWGHLYHLFAAHLIRVFPHEELKREALNLVTRVMGGRMKVVDSSAIHQDHVIALGGAADLLELRDGAGEFAFPEDPAVFDGQGGFGAFAVVLETRGQFAWKPEDLHTPYAD